MYDGLAFNKKNASLAAVFSPIPGRYEMSSTSFPERFGHRFLLFERKEGILHYEIFRVNDDFHLSDGGIFEHRRKRFGFRDFNVEEVLFEYEVLAGDFEIAYVVSSSR